MKRNARKLFFALWPPPEVAGAILAQARACGVDGRPVAAFSLSESMQVDGRAEYRDIERWPLGPASVE